ncbi:type II CRISPR RNA-guided endonuclease Cas9 [Spiroplasma clarkii]|uniref:type II CRISPR RNA-guided endonuclease Cas9 n=1 Tax=Spiroplasma clarkii TaxID=2139 RepID=UPI002FE1C480
MAEAIIANEFGNTRVKNNDNLLDVRNNVKDKKSGEGTKSGDFKFLFPREAYQYELEMILNQQAKYFPEITSEFIKKIIETAFRQRDFEDGFGPKGYTRDQIKKKIQDQLAIMKAKNVKDRNFLALRDSLKAYKLYKPFTELTGKCTFYPDESRYVKSSIIFEIYQMAVEVSKFSSLLETEEKICEFHNKLFEKALKDDKFITGSSKAIDKILIEDFKVEKEEVKNSKAIENAKKTTLFEFTKRFIKVFGMEILKKIDSTTLDKNFIDDLGILLNQNITPKRREEKIRDWAKNNNLEIDNEQVNELLFLPAKVTTTSGLSKKAMLEVIEKFLEGKIAGVYQDEMKANAVEQTLAKPGRFLEPIKDPDLVRNPVVFRAINEARKVIKALFNRYGDFHKINVETSRELGKSAEVRKELNTRNLENRLNNMGISKILEDNGLRANHTNILKYKLWKSQDEKCMYSLETILLEQFDTYELEIDHILPISKFPDDSIENKVLVFNSENQKKKNRTPLEYLNADNPGVVSNFKKIA